MFWGALLTGLCPKQHQSGLLTELLCLGGFHPLPKPTFVHLSGRPGDTRKLPHPHPTPPLHHLKLLLLFSCQVMSSSLQSNGLQAPLSFTISPSLLRFMSIESAMLSNHFILCQPFSFCLQSLSASACFPMSQLFKVLELQLQHQSS